MISLTNLLLLTCVTCSTLGARPLQQACMKIRKGFTEGFKHHIRPTVLPPGLPDYYETTLPECPGDYGTDGLDVMACDYDGIPYVKFIEPSRFSVQRTGNKDTFVVVQITLYCKTPPKMLPHADNPPPESLI